MQIADIITISTEIQSGMPVFSGTRVPVKNLFDYVRGGDTVEEFLHDFPSVSEWQVTQLLKLLENIITFNFSEIHEKTAA